MSRWKRSLRNPVILIILVGLLVRIVLWVVITPMMRSDSQSYMEMARQLQHWDFSGYNARRTPGYPLFLLLCGQSLQVVWLVQSLLGIASSVILYYIARSWIRPGNVALAIGLLYNLNPMLLLFEPTLLTESLATFFFLLSMLVLVQLYDQRVNGSVVARCVWLGLIVAALGMTRPMFLLLLPGYLVALHLAFRPAERRFVYLGSFIVPFTMIVVGWCGFNKVTIGYFGVTSLTGYTLTQHSGAFIDDAPARYDTLKHIYLRHRDTTVALAGSHSMTIWSAYPEMQQKTGMSVVQLSSELMSMSIGLFIAHPDLYLVSVWRSWLRFWAIGKSDAVISRVSSPSVVRVLRLWEKITKYPLLLVNAIFLCMSGFVIYRFVMSLIRRQVLDRELRFALAVVSIMLWGSIAQALLEFGENARYAVPFQPLVLMVVIVGVWFLVRRLRSPKVDTELIQTTAG